MITNHFDAEALSADMFDSRTALRSVLETFAPWLVEVRAQLHAAISTGDAEALGRIVHRMRGALAQLRATQAVGLVRTLDAQCRKDRALAIPPDHPALAALDAELDALASEVGEYLAALQE